MPRYEHYAAQYRGYEVAILPIIHGFPSPGIDIRKLTPIDRPSERLFATINNMLEEELGITSWLVEFEWQKPVKF